MFPSYAVIDVETPNRKNDAVCSIGIVSVIKGKPSREIYRLVNPETYFDDFNINLHGITPAMVKSQPTFNDVWEEIQDYLVNQIIVAHNAAFDLSVISKSINKYRLAIPSFSYICTLRLTKNLIINNGEGYGLKSLCNRFHIDQGMHHNALDDALACGHLFQLICSEYDINVKQEIDYYCYRGVSIKDEKTSPRANMKELIGIAQDILSDGILNEQEIICLNKSLIENKHLCGQYPYNDLLGACEEILADAFITEEERDYLMLLLNEFIYPSAVVDEHQGSNELSIAGKRFCLSGNFSTGTKSSIENAIISQGGECAKSVTRQTDILLIGGEGSENWLYGNYGSKVAKALQLQEKGHHIIILTEAAFANIIKGA